MGRKSDFVDHCNFTFLRLLTAIPLMRRHLNVAWCKNKRALGIHSGWNHIAVRSKRLFAACRPLHYPQNYGKAYIWSFHSHTKWVSPRSYGYLSSRRPAENPGRGARRQRKKKSLRMCGAGRRHFWLNPGLELIFCHPLAPSAARVQLKESKRRQGGAVRGAEGGRSGSERASNRVGTVCQREF